MSELREKIAREIERSIRVRLVEIKGTQVGVVDDLEMAADRILALPEIAEALSRPKPVNTGYVVISGTGKGARQHVPLPKGKRG